MKKTAYMKAMSRAHMFKKAANQTLEDLRWLNAPLRNSAKQLYYGRNYQFPIFNGKNRPEFSHTLFWHDQFPKFNKGDLKQALAQKDSFSRQLRTAAKLPKQLQNLAHIARKQRSGAGGKPGTFFPNTLLARVLTRSNYPLDSSTPGGKALKTFSAQGFDFPYAKKRTDQVSKRWKDVSMWNVLKKLFGGQLYE